MTKLRIGVVVNLGAGIDGKVAPSLMMSRKFDLMERTSIRFKTFIRVFCCYSHGNHMSIGLVTIRQVKIKTILTIGILLIQLPDIRDTIERN